MLHEIEDEQEFEIDQNSEPHKKRSLFFIVLLCILFFFSGCLLTRAFFAARLPDDPTAYDPITLEPKKPQGFFNRMKSLVAPPKDVLANQTDDRINILLLGQGGPGHDGPYLTDTMILASINTKTKQVAFTSIPRDLWVNIPENGYRKINAANSIGEAKQTGFGPAYATHLVQNIFDIEIPYYILVDFKAFDEILTKVDGVDVDVERSFSDYEYPIEGKENAMPESSRYEILNFKKGMQHMDAQTALKYSRSRHGNNGEGSDYARSRRQQKVILALKEKVLSAGTLLNPIKVNEVINSVQSHLNTNLQFADILAFLKLSRELDTQNLITLTLDDSPDGFLKSGYSAEGAFTLQPAAGNFTQIQNAIKNIFESTPPKTYLTKPNSNPNLVSKNSASSTPATNKTTSNTLETAEDLINKQIKMKIEVKNGTWKEGLATRVRKQLEDKGLTVSAVGNTSVRPKAKSGIYILTKAPNSDTVELLKSELHLPVNSTSSGEIASANTDILIILGEDFKE